MGRFFSFAILFITISFPSFADTIWVDANGSPTRQAREFVETLEASWLHGLNPETYKAAYWREQLVSPTIPSSAIAQGLQQTAITYIRHLSGPRVSPAVAGGRARDWRKPLSAEEITIVLQKGHGIAEIEDSVLPRGRLYIALQSELQALAEKIEQGDEREGVLPIKAGRTLRVGDTHPAIKLIRYRIGLTSSPDAGSDVFDDNLAMGLAGYQKKHGIIPDGVIGPQTIAALNKTNKLRYQQIVTTLERLRWLDPQPPEKYITVNIPQVWLWAMDDGRVIFDMPVIAGRKTRTTQTFKAEVTGVRFNPSWNIPDTIKVEDYWPKLKEDPKYFDDKEITVFEYDEETGEPRKVVSSETDWEDMDEDEFKKLRMVQSAGDLNALGKIRVLMPNEYNIYLHDTNTPSLFQKNDRFLSSGCVRLSDPARVADFILGENENWSRTELKELLDSPKTRDIKAAQPFPIFMLYQTVWLENHNRIIFGPDPYGWDAALYNALRHL